MTVAKVFGIHPGKGHRHFASRRWRLRLEGDGVRPHAILAGMAARIVGRPAKVAVTRQQMFALTGYRMPTIQRVRIGAEADGLIRDRPRRRSSRARR